MSTTKELVKLLVGLPRLILRVVVVAGVTAVVWPLNWGWILLATTRKR